MNNFGYLTKSPAKIDYSSFGNSSNPDGSLTVGALAGKYPDLGNETISPSLVKGGSSYNYLTKIAGWMISKDGNAEFNNITLYGGTISFGKTTFADDTNPGYWLGKDSGTVKLKIGKDSTSYLSYDGTNLNIVGGNINGGSVSGINLTGLTFNYGKTAFTDDSHPGYWLGVVSSTPKVKIGYDANAYFSFDGTNLALNGAAIKSIPTGASTGRSVQIGAGSNSDISFYNNTTLGGYIGGYAESAHTETSHMKMYASSGVMMRFFDTQLEITGDLNPQSDFGNDVGISTQRWNNVNAKTVKVSGTGAKFSCSGSDGVTGTFKDQLGNTITVTGGIITALS